MDAPDNGDLLDVEGAAEHLDLSTHTIYQYVSKGRIPYLKKGGRLYFRRSALDEWDEARTTEFVPDSLAPEAS